MEKINKVNDEVVIETENNQVDTKEPSKVKKVFKIIGKVFEYIGLTIVAFLVIVVGWLSIDKYILKSEVPSFFGYSQLIVVTDSMSGDGGIDAGDLIIIKDSKDYSNGDIITFMHEGEKVPTTHRIIFTNEDGTFTTKGDANNSDDTLPVSMDEIYGEVVLVIDNFGIFLDWIKNGGGLIYIIAIIAIVGLGIYVIKKI